MAIRRLLQGLHGPSRALAAADRIIFNPPNATADSFRIPSPIFEDMMQGNPNVTSGVCIVVNDTHA